MITTEIIKKLIEGRLQTNGVMDTRWCKEYSDDAFFGCVKYIGLLPTPCGSHYKPVYNEWGINCNTLDINHYKKCECLCIGSYVACSVYLCYGASKYSDDQKANNHLGEIYVAFERFADRGDGVIECREDGVDLSLDVLEQRAPKFLLDLVFNLK